MRPCGSRPILVAFLRVEGDVMDQIFSSVHVLAGGPHTSLSTYIQPALPGVRLRG